MKKSYLPPLCQVIPAESCDILTYSVQPTGDLDNDDCGTVIDWNRFLS